MAAGETDSVECPDVAPQYKAMVDHYTLEISRAAEALMAVVEELGCDSYRCTDGVYAVIIERADDTEGESDGGDSSTQN